MASNEYDAFEDSVEPLAEDAAKNTNAMVRTEGRLGRRYMSKGITGLIRLGRRISKDSKNWYFSLCDVIKVFFRNPHETHSGRHTRATKNRRNGSWAWERIGEKFGQRNQTKATTKR